MKALNLQACAVMDKLTEGLLDTGAYRKIDTGSFMAVNINLLYHRPCGTVFSVSHNYEQNGDLMADPDMTFLKALTDGKWYPLTYQLDGLGLYQESVVFTPAGEIQGYKRKLQADHASFANLWMKNIKNQQPEYFKETAPTLL